MSEALTLAIIMACMFAGGYHARVLVEQVRTIWAGIQNE